MLNKIVSDAIKLQRENVKDSILAFAETYCSEHLKYKVSKEQRYLYSLLENADRNRGEKIAIAAPRGSGKTTLLTEIYALRNICYGLDKYIVIISNTSSRAIGILDNVKYELKENLLLRKAFPEVCDTGKISRLLHWRNDEIITGNKVKVQAFGEREAMRGIKMGAYRPTLVIIDDLENSESTFSRSSREKMKNTLENKILMLGSEMTNYLFLGNLFHPHCLLGDYVSDRKGNPWKHVCYSAIMQMPKADVLWDEWRQIFNYRKDFEGSSGPEAALKFYKLREAEMNEGAILFWPERYTLYDLMVMSEENPVSFQNELQNKPIDPALTLFNTDQFQYWNMAYKSGRELLKSIGPSVEIYGFCDPAMGKDLLRGDYAAIVIIAYDRERNTIYVLEADIKRCRPDELIDDILSYARNYKFTRFGVEANGFQEFVIDQLQKKADEARIRIIFDKITTTQDKSVKIQALRFWVKGGGLQFHSAYRELLEEARYFPKGKYVDGLDALAMAVDLITSLGHCDMRKQSEILKKVNTIRPRMNQDFITVLGRGVINNRDRLFKLR